MTKDEFKQGFLFLTEMFNKTPSKPFTRMYFEIVKHLNVREWEEAIKATLQIRKFTNMPTPGEILEHAQGSPDDAAIIAIQKLENAMRDIGGYDSIAFDDPVLHVLVSGAEGGWPGLCQMTTEDWKFERMRLIKSYKAFAGRRMPDNIDHLVGIHESDNGGRFPDWKPTIHYIGEHKVKQIARDEREIKKLRGEG